MKDAIVLILSYSTSPNIEIRTIKEVNLKGGTVIDGFPSVGLINAIASGCFIHSLKNELVAVIDSLGFPALSVIYNGTPNFPARIYANENLKLAFLISELNLDQSMYYCVSKTILQWAKKNECGLVISAAGMPTEISNSSAGKSKIQEIYAVASTKKAQERLEKVEIVQLSSGSITGIPALLLNEGSWMNFDVIVLLTKVIKDVSDFRAAAAISEAVMKLLPDASCDINSLIKEAEIIEKNLREARLEQANSGSNVYR